MKLQFKNQKSEGTDPSCVTWLMGAGPSEGASAGAFWREAICFGELFVRRERSAGGRLQKPDVARAPSPLQQGRGGLATSCTLGFAIAS